MKYVIGGRGRIGSELVLALRQSGSGPFEYTTRHEGDGLFLDLAEPLKLPWGKFKPDSIVFIVAGANGFEACEGKRESYRVNVDAPVAIARAAQRDSAFPVFISTDAVEWCGSSAYARQKALSEVAIRMAGGAIIRPARVTPERAREFARFMLSIGDARQEGVFKWQ